MLLIVTLDAIYCAAATSSGALPPFGPPGTSLQSCSRRNALWPRPRWIIGVARREARSISLPTQRLTKPSLHCHDVSRSRAKERSRASLFLALALTTNGLVFLHPLPSAGAAEPRRAMVGILQDPLLRSPHGLVCDLARHLRHAVDPSSPRTQPERQVKVAAFVGLP